MLFSPAVSRFDHRLAHPSRGEIMVVLVLMLDANDAGSGPIHLVSTKKKKNGKIRIIVDLCHEHYWGSFPIIHIDRRNGTFDAQS